MNSRQVDNWNYNSNRAFSQQDSCFVRTVTFFGSFVDWDSTQMEDTYKSFFESDTEQKYVFGEFPEFSAYRTPPRGPEVIRVGWIGKSFQVNETSLTIDLQLAMQQLRKLICVSYNRQQIHHSNFTTGAIRGPSLRCPVCYTGEPVVHCQGEDVKINSFEIWIPSATCVFASPGLILHYVEDHGYVPPQAFLNAIAEVNEEVIYDADEHMMAILVSQDGRDSYFKRYLERLGQM